MKYWREIARRAWKVALKDVKMDTLPSMIGTVATQLVICGIIFWITGSFEEISWEGRFAAALAPLLVLPIMFLVRLITEPYELWREQQEIISNTKSDTDKNSEKREIREGLAGLLMRGKGLMSICAIAAEQPPYAEIESWRDDVVSFLRSRLDESYVVRFLHPTRLAFELNGNQSQEHKRVWNFVRPHVEALEVFIREFV